MHTELGGHFLDGQPAGPAEMLSEARNGVGGADVPHDQAGERLAGARAQAAAIERVGDLSIGLLGRKGADLLDDVRGRPPQIGSPSRERAFERSRGAPFPADVEVDGAITVQRDVLDEQAQHALALARRRPWIVPHPRQVRDQRLNLLAILGPQLGAVRLGGACVVLLQRRDPRELLIPLLFEGIGDQPVLGTDEHELALRELRLLPRALDLGPAEPIDLGLALAQFVEDLQGHIEGRRRHRLVGKNSRVLYLS
jgi:hypothetical protein